MSTANNQLETSFDAPSEHLGDSGVLQNVLTSYGDSVASLQAMRPEGTTFIDSLEIEFVDTAESGGQSTTGEESVLVAGTPVCLEGTATYYNPSGNPTADGTPYTSGNNALGIAYPMRDFAGGDYSDATGLNIELGDRVQITNTATGARTTTFAIDRGNFYREPGQFGNRLVDATVDTARILNFGPEGNGAGQIPVRVCNLDP